MEIQTNKRQRNEAESLTHEIDKFDIVWSRIQLREICDAYGKSVRENCKLEDQLAAEIQAHAETKKELEQLKERAPRNV